MLFFRRVLLKVRPTVAEVGDLGCRGHRPRLQMAASALAIAWALLAPALADPIEIKVGYLHARESKQRISLLDVPADNDGIAGAELALDDNNTTGRFINQHYSLAAKTIRSDDEVAAGLGELADQGAAMVIVDVDAEGVLTASEEAKTRGLTIFNVGATDDSLRERDCRANVIHVAPTRSMLADALAQYLMWKKWRRWLLVVGSHDRDKRLGDALRRSATRFGAKIVEEREFKDTGGARRTDCGIVEIQRQMPDFTQEAPDYDVLVAADESDVFAGYLPYRTWDPRPVAGLGRIDADELGPGVRPMGRVATAEPFRPRPSSPDDRARHAGLDSGAHDRRSGHAGQHRRPRQTRGIHQGARLLRRRIQGTGARPYATGTCNCASRSCFSTAATPCRSPRRRATCISSLNSTLSATIARRPSASCRDFHAGVIA